MVIEGLTFILIKEFRKFPGNLLTAQSFLIMFGTGISVIQYFTVGGCLNNWCYDEFQPLHQDLSVMCFLQGILRAFTAYSTTFYYFLLMLNLFLLFVCNVKAYF
eukprot:TRINITY_DN1577_c1_g1_i5.p2 TRINITY_DN1577_c1_g1~~TRINITY_DN1577_c1_g1_i5.p2  ORF type:complete len:104 (-),score=16.15 TRINITY_DN1577_c1_g1_i5:762-1073(-)